MHLVNTTQGRLQAQSVPLMLKPIFSERDQWVPLIFAAHESGGRWRRFPLLLCGICAALQCAAWTMCGISRESKSLSARGAAGPQAVGHWAAEDLLRAREAVDLIVSCSGGHPRIVRGVRHRLGPAGCRGACRAGRTAHGAGYFAASESGREPVWCLAEGA